MRTSYQFRALVKAHKESETREEKMVLDWYSNAQRSTEEIKLREYMSKSRVYISETWKVSEQ